MFPLFYLLIFITKNLIVFANNVVWPVILSFCISPTQTTEPSECLVAYAFSSFIVLFIEFILIGIVLGYLYGKFRNRKTTALPLS